jgi:hypothetical protein
VADEWTIKLTRDEGLVLSDYLDRWQRTGEVAFVDEAERVALCHLLGHLEIADDGTSFDPDYDEQLGAARSRLRPDG